jgi:hypothetical protein
LSHTVVREHGIRYLGLNPDQARRIAPSRHYPDDLVDIFAQETRHESPRAWVEAHADDLPAWRAYEARCADEHWATLAPEADGSGGCVPYERVVRDLDYAGWREVTPADVDLSRRGRDYRRLDWGVDRGDEVEPVISHDAATRALHNNGYGWRMAVRDVTPSPWARVGEIDGKAAA